MVLILGSLALTIGIGVVLTIIAIVIIFAVFGFFAAMLPYLIFAAVIAGIGYLIILVMKLPDNIPLQQNSEPKQEMENDVVATCKSMYDDSSTIKECVRKEGRL